MILIGTKDIGWAIFLPRDPPQCPDAGTRRSGDPITCICNIGPLPLSSWLALELPALTAPRECSLNQSQDPPPALV